MRSINDIIDHVIPESVNIYIGTEREDDFRIFCDGLTFWWTKESQEYIALNGFSGRELRCEDDTNKGTLYVMKGVGDSLEICRGLDAYGFSDFERSTEIMRASISVLDINDPKRFGFGALKEVWDTMVRCWTLEPTSAPIIADIEDFGMCLISSLNSRAAWYQSADCETAIGSKLTMVDAF